MNYRQELLDKINNLLDGKLTVPEFQDVYYDLYLKFSSDHHLSELDDTFFGLVQEKLDWTTEDPAKEDRQYGWMDYTGYISWLKINTENFIQDGESWHKHYFKR